jgi:hypothetical protein
VLEPARGALAAGARRAHVRRSEQQDQQDDQEDDDDCAGTDVHG